MKGHLLMSRKELHRKSVLEMVTSGRMTLVAASKRMELSYRQTLRVYQKFLAEGDAGLMHRRRGQASNRGYPAALREKVVERYRERYQAHELGPTLAAEKLAEEGLAVDHETLRRWIERHGIPQALYTNRKNVYITDREPTLEKDLAGQEPLTAFGQACHKLGIEIIAAHFSASQGPGRALQWRLAGPFPQGTGPAGHHHYRRRRSAGQVRLSRLEAASYSVSVDASLS